MKRLLTAFACCLVAGGAVAENLWTRDDWLVIGLGDVEKTVGFVRGVDERIDGSIHSFWVVWVNSNPTKPYDMEMTLTKANCKTGQLQQGQSTWYLRRRYYDSDDSVSNWKYPNPGSLGEAIYDIVCKGASSDGNAKAEDAFDLVPIGKRILRENRVR